MSRDSVASLPLAPDDARVRRAWRERVVPELRVPCSLHISARYLGRDRYGCCWQDGHGRWHVAVAPGMPYATAMDTMIHELAHLAGMMAGDSARDEHGAVWGVAYSHWYQIVMRTP